MARRALGAAIALGVGLLASALVLEVGLRIHNPIPVSVRANQIVLPTNKHLRIRNVANPKIDPVAAVVYNEIGFRGPGKRATFDRDVTLITFGGSTTACVGLNDSNGWPARVFETMAARHGEFWLNNAGMNGQSSFGHLMLLEQYVSQLKPDYALFLIGANEVGRADLNLYDLELSPDHASLRNRLIATSELLSTVQVLSRTRRAIDLNVNHDPGMDFAAIPRVKVAEDEARAELEMHAREYLPEYRRRLQRLFGATRDAGIRPIVMTQPAFYGEGIDLALGIERGDLQFAEGVDARLQWRILESYNDVLREEAARLRIPLIDLAGLMPKDSRYYFDWLHFSIEGARKVAEIVSEALETLIEWESGPERRGVAVERPADRE